MVKGETVVLASTRKGLFVARSRDRRRWKVEGPHFEGVEVHHAILDPRDGRSLWAAATSYHWGATVRRSPNLGARWAKPTGSPKYPEGSGLSVSRVWHVAAGSDGEVYAGVEPAGLFVTRDQGATWEGVEGLNAFPGRKDWAPGGGGLCLHTILPYPGEARRMVVAASAVGIFGTNDGGKSWRVMNGGVRSYEDDRPLEETRTATCPHKIVRDGKDPDVLFMQNHNGAYRRKRGDAAWTDISNGLPSRFGFPMAAHAHDAGTVYAMPLASDSNRVVPDGAPAVYRTRDAGKTWQRLAKGLPRKDAYWTVLREGLATDAHDPVGVYFGTTTGRLWASRDEGESWAPIAENLPPILAVTAGSAR